MPSGSVSGCPLKPNGNGRLRGTEYREYAWGKQCSAEYANFGNSEGKTTAVTKFPKAVSAFGIWDMWGNGWAIGTKLNILLGARRPTPQALLMERQGSIAAEAIIPIAWTFARPHGTRPLPMPITAIEGFAALGTSRPSAAKKNFTYL